MAAQYKRVLNNFVDNAGSSMDIISLLPFININILQQFLKDQIKQFSANQARKAYYESISIMNILPNDVMQHIISFNLDSKLKFVNKQWNTLLKQADKNYINEHHNTFNPIIPYNSKVNHTWIVNKDKELLKETEIKSEYKGPVESINEAIENCQSGDKLLIYNGEYECNALGISKDIQLIGVGKNVSISVHDQVDIGESSDKKGNVYMENISIKASSNRESLMYIEDSNLWMKNCAIAARDHDNDVIGVMVRDTANFIAQDCIFGNGILMSPTLCNVLVIGCTFKSSMSVCSTPSGAIEIFDNYGDVRFVNGKGIKQFVVCNLKCIDNVFERDVQYPISMRDFEYYPSGFKDYMLDHIVSKCNLWKKKRVVKLLYGELVPSVFMVASDYD